MFKRDVTGNHKKRRSPVNSNNNWSLLRCLDINFQFIQIYLCCCHSLLCYIFQVVVALRKFLFVAINNSCCFTLYLCLLRPCSVICTHKTARSRRFSHASFSCFRCVLLRVKFYEFFSFSYYISSKLHLSFTSSFFIVRSEIHFSPG